MKKASLLVLMTLMALTSIAQTYSDSIRAVVLLETSMGNIKIALANETPLHRDNFLKLVKEGAYDGVLFHRVIKDFMIQTGDLGSKNTSKGQKLKETKESYKVPAEIVYPQLFHHRGAVAAAREADIVNPERASSSSQFYIVYGWSFNEPEIDLLKHKIDSVSHGKIQMTNKVRQAYLEHGGSPHLDGGYTVFGEVIEGMDVVDKIQRVETDDADRPREDVRILKATVIQ